VSQEFADLLPVFLAEAYARLERLQQLLPHLASDEASRREAQRELHTLKGAGRMLKLASFAQLCHELEEAVQRGGEGVEATLQRGLDQLAAALQHLAAPAEEKPQEAAPGSAAGELVRLASRDLDLLADRATRLRIVARGARVFHQRLRELAALAQQAVHEPDPQQALAVLATGLRKLSLELELQQARAQRLAETHQEHVLSLQLQPLGPFLQGLARHARELAAELGKDIAVSVRGEEVRLDRRITRELEQALLHLVRNAVDHGIEPARERAAKGKNPTGSLLLQAQVAGAKVQLVVADDGRGIEAAQVLEAAVARGLVSPKEAQATTPDEALRLLFTPGFSTRTEATAVSGRGVGLDAVAAACARVGGEVQLSSTPGRGTSFTLTLPASRRGEEVLVLRVGRLAFLYPKAAVRRYVPFDPGAVVERGERSFVRLDGKLVPLAPLGRLFGEQSEKPALLLSGEVGGQELAVAVDEVVGEEEVVVRQLPAAAAAPPHVAGAAVTGSGASLPLLAPHKLRFAAPVAPRPQGQVPREPLSVLLVDDSLVTREMERRLLADAGFAVLVAGDAEEALAVLSAKKVDCLVTDIEMPEMNGLELTRKLRSMPQFAHLPVVVVSTRDRPEDRLAGLAAGADAYLAKQGLDASELVALVKRLGGRP